MQSRHYPKQVKPPIRGTPDAAARPPKVEPRRRPVRAAVRLGGSPNFGTDGMDARRRLVADLCKLIARQLGQPVQRSTIDPSLSTRLQQTLNCLLTGDSEKQIAGKLRISRHTVHVYVKALHKHFNVSSRGELLARCLRD